MCTKCRRGSKYRVVAGLVANCSAGTMNYGKVHSTSGGASSNVRYRLSRKYKAGIESAQHNVLNSGPWRW